MQNAPTIFFQSSLPRAGSTLFQNLIGQNPDFYVTPTSGVLELVFAARHNYTESLEFKAQDAVLMQEGFRGFCREGLLGYYSAITDKPYILDKSRGWGYYQDFLDFFYSGPKIVCMVRDLRSVFSSMEKQHRKHPEQNDGLVSDANMQGITTDQRVINWAQSQPVGLAIERLRDILMKGSDKNMLFLKFEDLTSNPQNELNKFYDFVGLPRFQHDPNDVQQITQEDDSVYGIYGDHTIKSVVAPVADDYNEILGHELSDWIKNNYPWFFERFGY